MSASTILSPDDTINSKSADGGTYYSSTRGPGQVYLS